MVFETMFSQALAFTSTSMGTMFILSEAEIVKAQERIQLHCQRDLFTFFDSAQTLIENMFTEDGDRPALAEGEPLNAIETKTCQKIRVYKRWIKCLLNKAFVISETGEYDESETIEAMTLPIDIVQRVIKDLLQILSCGRDLSDCGLLFISDVGNALGIDPTLIDTLIEQVQYDKRKDFTDTLNEYLNPE